MSGSLYSYKGEPMSLYELVECLNRDDKNPERGKISWGTHWTGWDVPCRIGYEPNRSLNGPYEYWYPNGNLWCRGAFKNGRTDGLYEAWHDNGQLARRKPHIDGSLNGISEMWHRNGQLEARLNYVNGKLDGLSEMWDSDGKLISREYYKNGKCVAEGKAALAMAKALLISHDCVSNNKKEVNKKQCKNTCRFLDKLKPSSLAQKVKSLGIDRRKKNTKVEPNKRNSKLHKL